MLQQKAHQVVGEQQEWPLLFVYSDMSQPFLKDSKQEFM